MKEYIKPLIIGVGLATVTLFSTTLLLFKPEPVQIGLGDERLSSYDFESRYENVKRVYANLNINIDKNKATDEYIRDYIAKKMVTEKIIQKIAEENKVKVEKKEIKVFMENYENNNLFSSTSSIRKKVVEQHLLKIKLEKELTSKFEIGENDLKSYYEKNKENFKLPESAEVSQILVENKSEAQDIVNSYRRGTSFEKLIKDYSKTEESKQKNGKMGVVMKSSLSEKMANAVFSTKEGDVSDIFETNTGFIVFKVEKKNLAQYLKFEDVKHEIEGLVKSEKTRQYLEKRVDEIFETDKFYISV